VTKHLRFLTLLLLVTTSVATAEPLRIVASIKPVHSLVAGITQGISEPELLMSSNQSPHHYSLRPSERRMLAEADLIFWIGPGMESFMPRLLNSLDNKNKAVSLIESQGLKLIPIRAAGDNHSDHDHDEHDGGEAEQEPSRIDAHIWLDSHNTDILVDAISQQIIRLDPEHRQQYLANSQRLHDRIAQLRKTLQQSLNAIKISFLTYHDGYQYFETEFGLHNTGFITTTELQPGARHIIDLKKTIKEKNIECVFYDAPAEPALLKSLLANSQARTFMLDPVGMLIPPGEDNWLKIMHSLADQFINCQQHL